MSSTPPPDRALGQTQSRILQALLQSDAPMSVEQLSRHLAISRNATYQHMIALERDAFIEKADVAQTKGRPTQTFRLTESGRAKFPKRYSLFARLLVGLVKSRMGADELTACLEELGHSLADEYAARVAGLKGDALIAEIAKIMLELGYEAEATPRTDSGELEIRAHNCVFHDLAAEHQEVCTLDLALISRLVGAPIDHIECVVRGGTCCRFRKIDG